ncbi:MATE family efflux transporter [Tautonia plasticadhaerens]|uniref:Multidrug-efflux transporter n=1 Tax=Tautonia plasticadhaerens TaxID=2527974 RepID=A0A518GUZ4_9BACT|nr:MATE family efflux transporter [Tautonia plasticadhaerens]QDV32410.1 Multidrug resistance protein NorM [Tautonia plasticadhaerens]
MSRFGSVGGGTGDRLRGALRGLAAEWRPMARLAGPVVLAELGWMAMGIVDTLSVGRLGAEAIGAVGLGHAVFFATTIAGLGLLLGLDTVISHAFGAGKIDECRRWLRHGVYLALIIAPPLMALSWLLGGQLELLGVDPGVRPGAETYVRLVTLSLPPLLLYFALRRYLQAQDRTGAIVFALVSANLVNLATNWLLIFGNLGFPRLGVAGAAWATVISRTWMALVLLVAVVRLDLEAGPSAWRGGWRPDRRRFRSLIALGLPSAGQLVLEMGAFATATMLVGRLEPASLAAHQVALNLASLTFMVPLGVSSAGAVRVGQAIGREDPAGAARSGWSALAMGTAFMAAAAVAFVLLPRTLLSAFTDEPGVIAVGVTLLWAAAVFQLFDGVQVICTGLLRGSGDTRTPMLANLAAHWAIGLPVGVLLCFALGRGVLGMWIGLSAGLIVAGLLLLRAWSRRVATLAPRAGERAGEMAPAGALES